MKLRKKWVFLLFLFIFITTPVVAEMTIHASGLPTPWPVGLVGALISIVGIFRYKSKRTAFDLLTKSALIITLIRSLAALISSGISGVFQYPVLAPFTALSVLPMWDSLHDWDSEEERLHSENIELTEMGEETTYVRRDNNSITIKTFKNWRYVFIGLAMISFMMQFIFVLNTAARNFGAQSQFVTQCSEIPTNRNGTIELASASNSTTISCTPQDKGFSCLVGNSTISFCDLMVSIFSFVIGVFYMITYIASNASNKRKYGRWFSILIAIFSLSYLIGISVIQTQGLDVTGLEKCDVDPKLLSSRSGYITEWAQEKANTARKIALL